MPESGPPITAVVVVHRVDPTATPRCIGSLLASEGVALDVVLVCNGGDDDWAALRAMPGIERVRLVRVPNEGFGAAVNVALRHVTADRAVFLLNDDAWVEPGTLRTSAAALGAAGSACVSVAPLVRHAAQPDRVDSMGVVLRANGEGFNAFGGRQVTEVHDVHDDVLGPSFSAALFAAGAFGEDRVGPLAERYFLYYEDVEWNIRARNLGLRSCTAPEAIAFHGHAMSTRHMGADRHFRMVQRNLLVLPLATLSWRSVASIWAGRLVTHGKGLITGPFRLARLGAFAGALRLAPWALRRRRRCRGAHPVDDRTLFAFSNGHLPSIDHADFGLRPES